jgi:phosphatidylethanolamine-binding protein (PEBP) family uncharacterized protein
MRGSGNFVAVALAVSAMLAGTAQAATLKITSSAFKEGGMIAAKYAGHLVTKRGAGTATDCGGQNVSPALSWTNVPDGTKSFGLVIYDPDGAKGGGAVHWIAYGIAGDLRSLPEGFGNKTTGYVGGTGAAGNHDYMAPARRRATRTTTSSRFTRSIWRPTRCSPASPATSSSMP